MIDVPPAAQQLIAMHQLGEPIETYRPRTAMSIFVGLFVVAFAAAWILIAASITNSSFIPFHLFSTDTTFSSDSVFGIVGIVFPLFGLLFMAFGLWNIVKAFSYSHMRAVVCTNGVAYIMRNGADAFRWEQVLKIFDRVSVNRSTDTNEQGFTSTSTHISHSYTVHCHDGRKFVFDNTLGRVQDLAETMEVQVARYQHQMPYQRY